MIPVTFVSDIEYLEAAMDPPPDTRPSGSQALRLSVWIWPLALAVCLSQTVFFGYQTHDADSRLYANMSADLANRPVHVWCAPEWNGHWHRQGLFFEHPAGMFWIGAALVRLGLPPFPAVYFINYLSYFLSLWLLLLLGRRLAGDLNPIRAFLPVWIWVLTPGFLQYVVRGNHEHPMALSLALTLYILLCWPELSRARALLGWSAALLLAVSVKGIAGLGLIPVAYLYWAYRLRDRVSFGILTAGVLVLLLGCGLYEGWYQQTTGTGFWSHYFGNQVHRSIGGFSFLLKKLGNLVYFIGRPLWFFFPWIVLLFSTLVFWGQKRKLPAEDRETLWLGIIVTAVFVLGYSLANRKADRYLFPIYPALALSTAWVVQKLPWTFSRRLLDWMENHPAICEWGLPLFLVLATSVEIYSGTHHYRFIRIWPGA